jgi:hypothetical protein
LKGHLIRLIYEKCVPDVGSDSCLRHPKKKKVTELAIFEVFGVCSKPEKDFCYEKSFMEIKISLVHVGAWSVWL